MDNNRFLAVNSNSGSVNIYDISTGANIFEITGLDEFVEDAYFLDGDSRIITIFADGTARVWDISSLEVGDAFQVACQRLGNNISLKDVQERYGLGELTPICGDNPPLPVDWSRLQ